MKALVVVFFCLSAAVAQERGSSHTAVKSPGGYVAHSLRFLTKDGEPEGRTFIEKDGLVVATLVGVRAVAFSPVADVLLVAEAEADDDLRHYLLNIGAGEFEKKGSRLDYIFGPRYVTKAEWSVDGKTITLQQHKAFGGEVTVVRAEDHLKRK